MSDKAGIRVGSSDDERNPTSHELFAGRPWNASYLDGPPPWAIGAPQPAITRLAGQGAFAGAVLDAGCGTGENALHLAGLGLLVMGFDVAEAAVARAREAAVERGLDAEFAVVDALDLHRLGRRFDTVLDCGLLHTFNRAERHDYVTNLASVTIAGGYLYVLCFSDGGPNTGPHPLSERELRATFTLQSGFTVVSLNPDRITARFDTNGIPAWLAKIERI